MSFYLITQPNCPSCEDIKPHLDAYLEDWVEVDITENPALKDIFDVKITPTLVWLDWGMCEVMQGTPKIQERIFKND